MFDLWKDAVVSEISIAVCVKPGNGKHAHTDRPYHGFVLNDEVSVKDYVFSDGRVMRTERPPPSPLMSIILPSWASV